MAHHNGKSVSRAIVEVKSGLRSKLENVRKQESAQKAAWIYSEPEIDDFNTSNHRRMLISQDRHEIYLVIAEYGSDYVKYLNDETPDDSALPFMTMNEFGPWDVTHSNRMKQLGEILLAFTLKWN